MLEYIIIIFFIILLLLSLINYFTKSTIIEGATGSYQEYSDDPLILAKKNAANIEVLKKNLDKMSETAKQNKTNTNTNTNNVYKNSKSISSLINSMSPSSKEDSQKNQENINNNPKTFNMQ